MTIMDNTPVLSGNFLMIIDENRRNEIVVIDYRFDREVVFDRFWHPKSAKSISHNKTLRANEYAMSGKSGYYRDFWTQEEHETYTTIFIGLTLS